jgi:hypothetical protein
MPSLGGTFDVFGREPELPCRWCGYPTATRLAPTDEWRRLEREPIPLHAVCGAEVIFLYHDLAAGRLIPDEVAAKLRQLDAGG